MTPEYEWDGLIGEGLRSVVESKLEPTPAIKRHRSQTKLGFRRCRLAHCELVDIWIWAEHASVAYEFYGA
jgi:hypothetical protein